MLVFVHDELARSMILPALAIKRCHVGVVVWSAQLPVHQVIPVHYCCLQLTWFLDIFLIRKKKWRKNIYFVYKIELVSAYLYFRNANIPPDSVSVVKVIRNVKMDTTCSVLIIDHPISITSNIEDNAGIPRFTEIKRHCTLRTVYEKIFH